MKVWIYHPGAPNARIEAEWSDVEELMEVGVLESMTEGDPRRFRVTEKGYQLYDRIMQSKRGMQ